MIKNNATKQQFSEMKPINNYMKTQLYIIGNGFDIMHDIPSKYSDFANFCRIINPTQYASINAEFPELNKEPNFLWSNFETALGYPDINVLLTKTTDDLDSSYIDLKDTMSKWIALLSMLISQMSNKKQLNFNQECSLFLTFNYTNTLEEIYSIPSSNCCHIHENYDKNALVDFTGYNYGHSRSEAEIKELLKDKGFDIAEPNIYDIKENIMLHGKNYDEGLRHLNEFLDRQDIKNITDIIVLGHSMSEVDYKYFEECKKRFPKCSWHIFYHEQQDLERKRKSIVDLELGDYPIELLKL